MRYTITKTMLAGEEITLLSRHDDNGQIWGIPFAEDNTMYQQYLAWCAEGNEAEEWNPWESAPTDEA